MLRELTGALLRLRVATPVSSVVTATLLPRATAPTKRWARGTHGRTRVAASSRVAGARLIVVGSARNKTFQNINSL